MPYDYAPWIECNKTLDPVEIDLDDPPCKHCKYWSPQVIYYHTIKGRYFDSVRLCWVMSDSQESMHQDFSCFKPKEQI